MDDVFDQPTAVINMDAAGEIMFGAFVKYSADGTVAKAVDEANSRDYIGVAGNDAVERDPKGFWSQYDPVPIAVGGVVNIWIQGGGTDLTAGNFVEIANDYGWCQVESGGAGVMDTSTTVAKCLENQEISDYTATGVSGTAGSATLTVSSSSNMAVGDYLYIYSDEASTGEVQVIKTVDSTTQVTLERGLSNTHTTNGVACVGVQIRALLL